MKIKKEHLNKYLKDNRHFSIDFRKKLGLDDLDVLTDYLNSLHDSAYADYLMARFNRMPKKNNFLAIIKKERGYSGVSFFYIHHKPTNANAAYKAEY